MPMNMQAQALVDAMESQPGLDFSELTIEEFRSSFVPPAPAGLLAKLAKIEDRIIDGGAGPVSARFYYPKGEGPFPITLYFHGSAFVIGTPELTDGICRTLARDAETLVISVDYRLAPEAPFPAAIEDAVAALEWTLENAGHIGGLGSAIAVGGDSAGGTIAAALAQKARDAGIPLRHQLLFYPPLDALADTASYRDHAGSPFLPAAMMRWAWRQYAQGGDATFPAASPSRQPDLTGVASATIFTAEYDILRDEAEAYAAALARAGTTVTLKRWLGQPHAFMLMHGVIGEADVAVREAAKHLQRAFAAS